MNFDDKQIVFAISYEQRNNVKHWLVITNSVYRSVEITKIYAKYTSRDSTFHLNSLFAEIFLTKI